MSALGQLVVALSLEHAQFTQGLDKSSQEALRFAKNAQGAMDRVERSAGNVVKTVLGFGAAFVSVNKVIDTLGASVSTLAALDDAAQKTGSSVENLSRLQKVASAFGQDFGVVEQAVTKLARGIADVEDPTSKANKALSMLGVTSRDNNGQLRDSASIMIDVAKRLQTFEDGAAKAQIATDLFGKSGVELLPYLNDMAENVDKFTGASAESAAQAAALEDRMNALKQSVAESSESIVVSMMPALEDITKAMAEAAKEGGILQAIFVGMGGVAANILGLDQLSQSKDRLAEINQEVIKIQASLSGNQKRTDKGIVGLTPQDIQASINKLAELGKEQAALQQFINGGDTPASPYKSPKSGDRLDYNSGTDTNKTKSESLRESIALLKQENELIAQGVPVEDARTIAKLRAQGATDAQIVSMLNAQVKNRELTDAIKAEEKSLKDAQDARKAYTDGLAESVQALGSLIETERQSLSANQQQIDYLINGKQATDALTIARIDDTAAAYEQNVVAAKQLGLAQETIEYLETQAQGYRELADLKRKNLEADADLTNIKASQKAAEDAIEANKRAVQEAVRGSEEINRSITDALLRGFESGEGYAENFKRTLINTFRSLTLRPIISFLVDGSGINKVMATLTGALGSSTATAGGLVDAGGGFGGVIKQLSGLGDIFNQGNSYVVNAVEKLGTFLSSGNGGLGDVLGGFLGQNASAIADGFGYLGAVTMALKGNLAGAALTGIGTALGGPIGGAIGGLIGGLFGGKSAPKRNYAQSVSTTTNNVFNTDSTFSKRDGAQVVSSLTALNQEFSNILGGFLKGVGASTTFANYAAFSTRPTKSTTANFGGYINGTSFGTGEYRYGKKDQDAFANFVNQALGSSIAIAIRLSNTSGGIKKFFEDLTSGGTKKEDVLATINAIVQTTTALKDLPPVFDAIRNAIETTSYKTSIADLQKNLAAVSTYTSLFYSAEEQFATFTKQLTTQVSALGVSLFNSREDYRAYVDGLKVTDASTSSLFNGLVALAPAMDAYFKQIEAQKEAQFEAANALAQQRNASLNQGYFSTASDFKLAQASNNPNFYVKSQTQMNAALLAEIQTMKKENADLKAVMLAVSEYTYKQGRVLDDWDVNGMPAVRVA